MNWLARAAFVAVLVCFFFSGLAGLVYEIAWFRYLALFLGHSSYAVVAVLVAFMGGLALGNAWLGWWTDRLPRPLLLYGWLEIGIGLYGILFPQYYQGCHAAFVTLARNFEPGSAMTTLLKFGFALLTILLPTVLMGGTLPALARFVTRSLGGLRPKVAALYCINSTGAVAGIVIADFWWVPSWGLERTVLGGAALNLLVGVVALGLAAVLRAHGTESLKPGEEEKDPAAPERFSQQQLRLAVLCIGASGFVAMLYEVAWTRLLALALGSSTHAFSLMLLTFIAGIAAGGWTVYRWKGRWNSLQLFGWAELTLAATLLVSMFLYEYLPFWFAKLAGLLARKPEAYPLYEALQAMLCFAVMFGPCLCLGMTLPLASRVATAEVAQTGRSVGRVFAVNTLGTVLGASLTGLVLLPWLGLAKTFALGVAANAAIALAIVRVAAPTPTPLWIKITAGGLIAVALGGSFSQMAFERWQRVLTMGLWRVAAPPRTVTEYRRNADNVILEFYRDGAGGTVTVNSWLEAGRKLMSLRVNGKADASTNLNDMITQLLLGHVPMLLHPHSREVLVVGLGSGVTVGAVAAHPSTQRMDVVEIQPEVAQAARLFSEVNRDVLTDPRLRLYIEDAKTFLQITPRAYDVIISEPSNPWMAGVAGVFTKEFFENCRARLRPDGLMVQWVHVYEMSDEALDVVIRTFAEVFPWTSLWQVHRGDLMLVGAIRPQQTDLEALVERFAMPGVAEDLKRVKIFHPAIFLSREAVSQFNTRFIPPEGPVHSDYHPRLEYMAQRDFFVRNRADRWRNFDESESPRPTTTLSRYLQKNPLTVEIIKDFTHFYGLARMPEADIMRSLLLRWQQLQPDANEPVELAATMEEPQTAPELQALRLAQIRSAIWDHAERNPNPLIHYRRFLLAAYRKQRSAYYLPPTTELETVLNRLRDTDPQRQRQYLLERAELAWDRGDDALFMQLAQTALDVASPAPVDYSLDPEQPARILMRMLETLWRNGRIEEMRQVAQMIENANYSSIRLNMTIRKVRGSAPFLSFASE